MEKKMLYNFIVFDYIGLQFRGLNNIYDYVFSKDIGFNECYFILKEIEKSILNNQLDIKINNCKFISNIKIVPKSNRELIDKIYNENPDNPLLDKLMCNYSKLLKYENNLVIIETEGPFDKLEYIINYELLRYSLYIVYYKYLKENNPIHEYIKFIEYISLLDFENFTICEKSNNFGDFIINNIDSLNQITQQPISEELFCNIKNFENELRYNWNINHPNLE